MTCPDLVRDEHSLRQPLPSPFDWWVRVIVDALLFLRFRRAKWI